MKIFQINTSSCYYKGNNPRVHLGVSDKHIGFIILISLEATRDIGSEKESN